MEKFTRTQNGYDPDEVNAFLDKVINHVEKMVSEMKEKDKRIKELEEIESKSAQVKEKLEHYENMQETLNKAFIMAQRTTEQIKSNAYQESDLIIGDAKKNANRIVNEALLKAEKAEDEAAMVKRNVNVFKRRLRSVLEEQLEMVNEIEKIDL